MYFSLAAAEDAQQPAARLQGSKTAPHLLKNCSSCRKPRTALLVVLQMIYHVQLNWIRKQNAGAALIRSDRAGCDIKCPHVSFSLYVQLVISVHALFRELKTISIPFQPSLIQQVVEIEVLDQLSFPSFPQETAASK